MELEENFLQVISSLFDDESYKIWGYKNANLSIRLDLWKIVELIRCLKTSL